MHGESDSRLATLPVQQRLLVLLASQTKPFDAMSIVLTVPLGVVNGKPSATPGVTVSSPAPMLLVKPLKNWPEPGSTNQPPWPFGMNEKLRLLRSIVPDWKSS